MSEMKTVFALGFMYILILILLGSIAVGNCKEDLGSWTENPPGLFDLVGALGNECSGMPWINLMIYIPLILALTYIGVKALPLT